MATITITKSFLTFPDSAQPLLSAHVPCTMVFEFDRGTQVNTYAKVEINGISFFATKTATVGNVDTYKLSGSMLRDFLQFPDFDYTTQTNLSLTVTVEAIGYSSAGVELASATDTVFELCHGIPTSSLTGMANVQSNGRSATTIYFADRLSYFSVADQKYKVATATTGTFTDDGCFINVVNTGDPNIYWLNVDGCWDSGSFTEILTERKSKKGDSVALYADDFTTFKAYDLNYKNEVEETKTFKTIALNEEHYRQMYFITQSLLIVLQESGVYYYWELASEPAPIASCKQNLNFTFSLKRKTHGQSY